MAPRKLSRDSLKKEKIADDKFLDKQKKKKKERRQAKKATLDGLISRPEQPRGLIMLGKRKREVTVASRKRAVTVKDESTLDTSAQDAQERLRKYFESRFEPLELPGSRSVAVLDGSSNASDTDDSDQGEWDGIEEEDSGEDEDSNGPAPEVVDYSKTPKLRTELVDKATVKKFMVSALPSLFFSNNDSQKHWTDPLDRAQNRRPSSPTLPSRQRRRRREKVEKKLPMT